MLTRPEWDEAEANSHKAKANYHKTEAKIPLIFKPNFTFWPHFLKKTKVSVNFRRDYKNFGSKRAVTWEPY